MSYKEGNQATSSIVAFVKRVLLEIGHSLIWYRNKLKIISVAASPKQLPARQGQSNINRLGKLVMCDASLLFAYVRLIYFQRTVNPFS